MEKVCNGQDSESAVVFEVIGEPAIVINGVPNLPPGCTAHIHEDNISDAESGCDPCLGEWLVGRKVQKMFGGQLYSGKVVKYDSGTKWYRVLYEDGDLEDVEWHELEEVLLPLDISVPLITLALQRSKCVRSASESGLHLAKTNRTHTRSIVSMEKTPELLPTPHLIESRVGKLSDANFNSERTCQVTWEQQKETRRTPLSMEKTPELLPTPHLTESTVGKLSDAKINSERKCQVTWEKQKEIRRTPLQMGKCEVSVSRPGENSTTSDRYQNLEGMTKAVEVFQSPQTTEIKGETLIQANLSRGATDQDFSKRRSEFQKQSWRTARAEKQKRREKA